MTGGWVDGVEGEGAVEGSGGCEIWGDAASRYA